MCWQSVVGGKGAVRSVGSQFSAHAVRVDAVRAGGHGSSMDDAHRRLFFCQVLGRGHMARRHMPPWVAARRTTSSRSVRFCPVFPRRHACAHLLHSCAGKAAPRCTGTNHIGFHPPDPHLLTWSTDLLYRYYWLFLLVAGGAMSTSCSGYRRWRGSGRGRRQGRGQGHSGERPSCRGEAKGPWWRGRDRRYCVRRAAGQLMRSQAQGQGHSGKGRAVGSWAEGRGGAGTGGTVCWQAHWPDTEHQVDG